MGESTFIQALIRHLKTITIEPVIFLYSVGMAVILGAQITTNLITWKVCHIELGYSGSICQNLSENTNKSVEVEVQESVNTFLMYSNWVSSVPMVLFAAIAGPLSDRFGRKNVILIPIVGYLLAAILDIVNYAYINTLPLEFFYVDNIGFFFGGTPVLYLGTYSYMTDVTVPSERSYRMARLDGCECLASVLGNFLSPLIFQKFGYYGSYSISAILITLSLVYLFAFVKGTEKTTQSSEKNTFSKICKAGFTIPFLGVKTLVTKQRKVILKLMILVLIICFSINWLIVDVKAILYLFMLLVFNNFNETDFAYFMVANELADTFYLLLAMPLMSAKFKINDTVMLFIMMLVEGATYVGCAFVNSLWQIYILRLVASIAYCKYAVVRSLVTKCIDSDEVGSVFSLLAVLAALVQVGGNSLFRNLYTKTVGTFPGAIYVISGSLCLASAGMTVFLYIHRDKMSNDKEANSQPQK